MKLEADTNIKKQEFEAAAVVKQDIENPFKPADVEMAE
jgi:protein-arginine kinase activator protein McsA